MYSALQNLHVAIVPVGLRPSSRPTHEPFRSKRSWICSDVANTLCMTTKKTVLPYMVSPWQPKNRVMNVSGFLFMNL